MARARSSKVRGGAKATIDHDEIRRWVEQHGGEPAIVKGTDIGKNKPGILRVDFPGFSGERTLKHVDWDEWFDKFEASKLAFLYQDETGRGRPSRFNKLVGRETVEVSPRGRTTRAVKKSVPRRWAKKGARSRAELDQIERRAQTGARSKRAAATRSKRSTRAGTSTQGTKRRASAGSARPRTRSTRATSGRSSRGGSARTR